MLTPTARARQVRIPGSFGRESPGLGDERQSGGDGDVLAWRGVQAELAARGLSAVVAADQPGPGASAGAAATKEVRPER